MRRICTSAAVTRKHTSAGTASIARRTHPESPSAINQRSGGVVRADPLGEAEIGRAPARRAPRRDRPQEQQQLTVKQRKRDADQAVQEERAEDPGCNVGSERPPRAPTARMIATGPVVANRKASAALTAYTLPKS